MEKLVYGYLFVRNGAVIKQHDRKADALLQARQWMESDERTGSDVTRTEFISRPTTYAVEEVVWMRDGDRSTWKRTYNDLRDLRMVA